MAETKPGKKSKGFTNEERAAMRERGQELKAASGRGKADGESDVLAKIAEMPKSDRVMAERLHALINGAVGAVSLRDGKPFSIGAVTVRDGKIVELDFLADPERLAQLDLTILDG